MSTTSRLLLPLALAAAMAAPAAAKDKEPVNSGPAPATYQSVLDCRTVADPQARLACYDKAVGAMAQAAEKKDLVIVDRATMRETRRGLFGITLPKIKLFGDGDEDEVTEIETKIAGISRRDENYLFTLEDGAVWAQTDGRWMPAPKPGMPIRIRRASLGSYFANVNGATAIRVKRENR